MKTANVNVRITMFVLLAFVSLIAHSQVVYNNEIVSESSTVAQSSSVDSSVTGLDVKTKIVINMDMVKRFNDYQPAEEYVTMWGLIKDCDFETMKDYYVAYQSSDLDEVTLNEIYVAVNKAKENGSDEIETLRYPAYYSELVTPEVK